MNTPKFVKLKASDNWVLGNLFTGKCKGEVIDGVRYAVYEDGWDDARILAEFKTTAPYAKLSSVQDMRSDLFGTIRKPKPKPQPRLTGVYDMADIQQLLNTINELDRRVAVLTARLLKLEKHVGFAPLQPTGTTGSDVRNDWED